MPFMMLKSPQIHLFPMFYGYRSFADGHAVPEAEPCIITYDFTFVYLMAALFSFLGFGLLATVYVLGRVLYHYIVTRRACAEPSALTLTLVHSPLPPLPATVEIYISPQLQAWSFLCVDVRAYIHNLVSKNMRARFRRSVVPRITFPHMTVFSCRKPSNAYDSDDYDDSDSDSDVDVFEYFDVVNDSDDESDSDDEGCCPKIPIHFSQRRGLKPMIQFSTRGGAAPCEQPTCTVEECVVSALEVVTCRALMSCPTPVAPSAQLGTGQGLRTPQRKADGVALLQVGSSAPKVDAPTNVPEVTEEQCSVATLRARFGASVPKRCPGGNTSAVNSAPFVCPYFWRNGNGK
jgi:hypothetical protein